MIFNNFVMKIKKVLLELNFKNNTLLAFELGEVSVSPKIYHQRVLSKIQPIGHECCALSHSRHTKWCKCL